VDTFGNLDFPDFQNWSKQIEQYTVRRRIPRWSRCTFFQIFWTSDSEDIIEKPQKWPKRHRS